MFKKNLERHDNYLFNMYNTNLPEELLNKLEKSWSGTFYKEIFKNIDEKIFDPLYSERYSRPNFPINILIGLEIIKMKLNISDEELLNQYHFNLQVRYALGLSDYSKYRLGLRTIYYFRKRLLEHEFRTDENLLEKCFDKINKHLIENYKINTEKIKVDSTLIGSNIKNMSRLELLLTVLKNYLKVAKNDKLIKEIELIEHYEKIDSKKYIFKLRKEEVEKELKEIGILMYKLLNLHKGSELSETKEYKLLSRVFKEHYILKDNLIELNKDLKSTNLQSPYDAEATYRKKGNKESKGYSLNVCETVNKEELNIITDIKLEENVKSDGKLLNESVDKLEELGVKEIYADGGYDEKELKENLEKREIDLKLTGLKGRKSKKLSIEDFKIEDYEVIECPSGERPLFVKDKGEVVLNYFSHKSCENCSLNNLCPVSKRKKYYVLKISKNDINNERNKKLKYDYSKNVSMRASIEGTIFQFKRYCYNGKIKYRGKNRIRMSLYYIAFSINLSRICKYIDENNRNILSNLLKQVNKSYFFNLFKSNFLILKHFFKFYSQFYYFCA